MAYQYSTDDIIDALKATNGLISLAAKRLGCCSQTIYNRATRVQKVQDTIDACRDELVDLGELALRSAVVNKEPWAVSLVLKTLGRHRGYVERQDNEVSGKDGGPVTLAVVERIVRADD